MKTNPGTGTSPAFDHTLLRHVLQCTNSLLMVMELNSGTWIEANDEALRQSGYTKDEFLRLSPADICKELPALTEEYKSTIGTHCPCSGKQSLLFLRKDHQGYPVDANLCGFREGELSYLLVHAAVKQQQPAQPEAVLPSSVFNSPSDAIIILDANLEVTGCNRMAQNLFGWKNIEEESQLSEKKGTRFLSPSAATELKKVLSSQDKWSGEIMAIRENGETFPAFLTIENSVLNGRNNETFAIVKELGKTNLPYQDIHHQNAALEKQAEQKTADIYEVLEKVSDAVVAIDNNWTYTYINSKAEKIMKLPAEYLLGKNMWEVYSDSDAQPFREAYEKAMKQQEYLYFEHQYEPLQAYLENHIYPSPNGLYIFLKDITARKKAEADLAKMELRYKTITDAAHEGMWETDTSNTILFVNDYLARLLGYTKEEMIGKNISEFVMKSDIPNPLLNTDDLSKCIGRQQETILRTREGNAVYTSVQSMVLIQNDECIGTLATILDITEQQQFSARLVDSKSRLQALVEHGTDGIMVLNSAGHPTYVSPGFAQMSGYTEEETMSFDFASGIHPDDVAIAKDKWEESLMHPLKPVKNIVFRIRHKKGNWIWIQSTLTNHLDTPDINGIINNFTDITLIKQSEERDAFHAQILNTIGQAVIATDMSGVINYWNKASEDLYGWTAEETIGTHIFSLMPSTTLREQTLMIMKDLHLGKTWSGNFSLPRKNGTEFPAFITHAAMRNREGNLIGVIGISHDISELVKAEREMKLLLHNTEEAFVLLDKHLNIVSFNSKYAYYCQTFCSQQVVKGTPVLNYKLPADLGNVKETLSSVLNGTKQISDAKVADDNGNIIFVSFTFSPAKDEHGNIIGAFISILDVTAEKMPKKKKISEKRNKEALINTTDDMIWSVDDEFRLVAANDTFLNVMNRFTYRTLKKGDNLMMEEFYSPDFLQLWKQLYARALQGESFVEEICTSTVIEGEANWEEVIFKPVSYGSKITGIACYARNINLRKQAERKEKERLVEQQLFTAIIQSSDDSILSKDLNGNLTSWNTGAEKTFGYKAEEIIGKHISLIIPPERVGEEDVIDNAIIKKQFVRNFESERLTKWGTLISVSLTVSPILDADNTVIGSSKIIRDITDRKQIELKIKRSEQRYRTMFEQSLAGFYESTISGTIIRCNEAFAQMLKYSSPEELIDTSVNQLYYSTDHREMFIEKLKQNGKIQNYEGILKCKDGSPIYYIENVTLRTDESGDNILDGIILNISEKKLAEMALTDSKERYDLAAKATSDVIWDWNIITGEVLRSADSMKQLFGYSNTESTSSISFWTSNIHPDDQERIDAEFINTFTNPEQLFLDSEYRFRRADGTYAFVYDKGYIIRNSEGNAVRMIGAVQDITRLKESETLLQKRAEELESSNRELEQFAYVASHDLQEPLRMITSFLTQLHKNYHAQLDDRANKYIDFAVDGAVRMRQIVLDLLSYSRVGNKDEALEKVDLNEVVKEIKVLFQKKIQETSAVITADALPVLVAHHSPFRQLLQNLISNALTYINSTTKPVIHIWAEDKGSHWQFAVADNGIGIEEEYFEKIFIIFQRLHSRDKYAGTGMGLSISKKIVESLGGNIWLTSREGVGSTFYFTVKKDVADL